MKTIYKYIFIPVLALFAGCDPNSFLDIKPRGKDIPTSYVHYEGLLNSFNMIKFPGSAYSGNMFFPVLSDEYYVTEHSLEQLSSSLGQEGREAYKYNRNFMLPDALPSDWNYTDNTYVFNLIINNVMDSEGGDEKSRLAVQSEARVMRAWSLFRTAMVFCKPYDESTASQDLGIPIVREADTNLDNFERGTLKDLYDFIVTEMEESAPNIGNETALLYRTERADAYMMLGLVYYYMNRYDDALTALREAKRLADESGAANFYDYNEQTEEWIKSRTDYHFSNIEYMRDYWWSNSCIAYYSPSYAGEGITFVKQKYYDLYGDTDRRKLRFLNEDGNMRPLDGDVQLGLTSPTLYIALAECEARSGDESSAKSLLEEFRKYRMPASDAAVPADIDTKDKLIRFCVEERIREELGTGLFFFEMRRLWDDPLFQDLKADYGHEVVGTSEKYELTEDNLVMMIPTKVMSWNPDWENN